MLAIPIFNSPVYHPFVPAIPTSRTLVPTAAISVDHPNIIFLTYPENVYSTDNSNIFFDLGMTVKQNGSALGVTMGRHGEAQNIVLLYLEKSINAGDTMLLSYDKGTGVYTDSASISLNSFTDLAVTNSVLTYDWMETQIHGYAATAAGMPDLSDIEFPHVMMGESGQIDTGDDTVWLKYDILGQEATGMARQEAIQAEGVAQGVKTHLLRMANPAQTLEYQIGNGDTQGFGVPHANTGPSTVSPIGDPTTSTMFAGHWLYLDGTDTTAALASTGGLVHVVDGTKCTVGEYVCIRDGKNDWTNATHRKITAISGNDVTLSGGFNCTEYAHGSGSYVSMHCREALNKYWVYNMSTACPTDGNGKKMHEIWVEFLTNHLKRDTNGNLRNVDLDGFLFDVDRVVQTTSNRVDANNDGVIDNGANIATSENWWTDGLQLFYEGVRAAYPTMFIIGGTRYAADFGSATNDAFTVLNGRQQESFTTGFPFDPPSYGGFSAFLASYVLGCHVSAGQPMECPLQKQGTIIHPTRGETNPNSIFRLSFGATLLDNGWFAHQNTDAEHDCWYDEYAVDVVPGSPTYGEAIAYTPSNGMTVRQHKDWLGQPLSNYYRVYDNTFDDANNLISNNFSATIAGWSTNGGGTPSHAVGEGVDGSNALKVTDDSPYDWGWSSREITGESMDLVSGEECTFCFTCRTDDGKGRFIRMNWGGCTGTLMVDGTDRAYVISFVANTTGLTPIKIQTERYAGNLWLSRIKFFPGSSDVFRRDFEHGVVLVNNTITNQRVELESNDLLRINGTQDPVINSGSAITWGHVTVPPRDSIILVRGDHSV
ncbi:MAG: hypothetical protein ACN4GR_17350 [Arenicellales bacterium]